MMSLVPFYDVTIESGTKVSKYVQFFLGERQDEFPGAQVQKVYQTQYPMGTLAA